VTARRRVAAVTGSRADFGLLEPVLRAVHDHPALDLAVLAAGAHLLPPERTVREVRAAFRVAATVPMQRPGSATRAAEAEALGRGVSGFARCLAKNPADVVLVLGDRVEAFAAAAAASVAGVRVAHLHGGDRATGIADEALRHAITKLAHIHLAATRASAERIASMGEEPDRIHVVGSPAIDGLDAIPPLPDAAYQALGRPEILVLLHPAGGPEEEERALAGALLAACRRAGRVMVLRPNHDPGRGAILGAIEEAMGTGNGCGHLPRRDFVGLLRRVRLLAGNSSAGLIECAALGVPCVNVGPRQDGRERAANVIDAAPGAIEASVSAALARPRARAPAAHPFGDGRAGVRAAAVLAGFDPLRVPLAKRNTT
jgi:UDP-hydrolysing UDP-N-acetyl-D-glucosamine 2-epimerase